MNKVMYLFLFMIALWSCKETNEESDNSSSAEELESVSTVVPEMTIIKDEIEASGVLSSKAEIKLAFKTGGLIKRMYVKEGQSVKKGQLLAELDLSEIDAMVNQAKLGLSKSERDLNRVKEMLEDEVATKNNLEDAKTAFELAKESLESAVFNQRMSKIYAPQAGKILMKISEQGELITPFAPALILGTNGRSFNVKVGLSDRDVVRVKEGNRAHVYLDAYEGETFEGRISEIAQIINPTTGTYEVELTLDSKGKSLISGFVAKAIIYPPNEKKALMIPASSLLEAERGKAYVFVNKSGTVEKREIQIGEIHSSGVEVENGLDINDEVVSLGASFLSPGQKIKVVSL